MHLMHMHTQKNNLLLLFIVVVVVNQSPLPQHHAFVCSFGVSLVSAIPHIIFNLWFCHSAIGNFDKLCDVIELINLLS